MVRFARHWKKEEISLGFSWSSSGAEGEILGAISHSWEAESIEQKARWFQPLSLEERMELFCQYTDLLLALNPEI